MPIYFWLLLSLFAVAGCQHSVQSSPMSPSQPLQTTFEQSGDFVQIERGPCFGACPAYKAQLNADGGWQYQAHGQSQVIRTQRDPRLFQMIRQQMLHSQFMSLPSDITPRIPELCSLYATDHAAIVLTAKLDGREHQVVHYLGCQQFPQQAQLEALEHYLEQALELTQSD